MVPEAGFEPARPRGRGIFVPLRLSPPPLASRRRSWSGARLHPGLAAVGARRLLSTPSRPEAGLARRWRGLVQPRAFADFDGRHPAGFPGGAQIVSSPLCLPISPLGRERGARCRLVRRSRGATINHPQAPRQCEAGRGLRHLSLSPQLQRQGQPSGYCAM